MTERILGPTGGRRRKRLLLLLPFVALAAMILVIGGNAGNSPAPVNFELEGDLQAGIQNGGGGGPTADGSDWAPGDATGQAALVCSSGTSCPAVVNATGEVTNVVDGPAPGTGELFRDRLKVDPDNTTFTQGDKENDTGASSNVDPTCTTSCLQQSPVPWHIVTGSVPPNKDDLFDIGTNTYLAGNQAELDLGMLRTNNNGSSHVDFELNRQDWTPGSTTDGSTCGSDSTGIPNFKCPTRTEGDLLISFEISPSSTTPPVEVQTRFFVWDLPGGTNANGHGRGGAGGSVDCQGPLSGNENTCPWEEIQPPAGVVTFAVNAVQVPAGPWGSKEPNGTATNVIPAGGWFEAAIDLDQAGFPPSCPGFGTASAKSRSSGSSVTSALTDLGGPFPINLNVCGKLHIIKDAQPDSSQSFSYTTTGGLSPSTFNLVDNAPGSATRHRDYDPLSPGNYSVTESAPGGGYAFSSVSCVVNHSDASDATTFTLDQVTRTASVHIGNFGEATCTYVNVLQRSLIISKVAKDASTATSGNEPLGGVSFVIDPDPTDGSGTLAITDDGAGDQFASTAGKICVNLGASVSGTFSITETVPTGYAVVGDNPKTGIASSQGTCASRGTGAAADAAFVNNPLSKFTIDFDALAPGANGTGATAANISCTGISPTPADGTPAAFDDNIEVYTNLTAQSYTCTINIDP